MIEGNIKKSLEELVTAKVQNIYQQALFSVIIRAQEEDLMEPEYTAIVKQQGDWWIGWVEEVPGVNCQERTREELLETLRITLQEAIEFNRQDAIASAGTEYEEEKIAVGA